MPRKFYLIAHNTNRVPQVIRALRRGANAIQPDLHYWPGKKQFSIYHLNPILVTPLDKYLGSLALKLLNEPDLNLAMIIIDLKPPYNYELRDLYDIIRRHFLEVHPDIPVLTAGNNHEALSFLQQAAGDLHRNEAIGVDERVLPEDAIAAFSPLGLHYAYASGSSVLSTIPYLPDVRKALQLRGQDGLRMVYAWTVNARENMKAYLDLEPPIDGIMTDDVANLLEILQMPSYKEKFTLAKRGDNPFV